MRTDFEDMLVLDTLWNHYNNSELTLTQEIIVALNYPQNYYYTFTNSTQMNNGNMQTKNIHIQMLEGTKEFNKLKMRSYFFVKQNCYTEFIAQKFARPMILKVDGLQSNRDTFEPINIRFKFHYSFTVKLYCNGAFPLKKQVRTQMGLPP